jgi:ADP-heptose:LPS heptosyltransferase
MEGGGHYDWNQGIDKTIWHETMKTLIDRIRKRHRIAFLCHNRKEYESAKRLNSSIERFLPTTPMEYFRIASNAKAAICNRMHASVGLAGMGIPSVAVGTDTRILMVKALELPCYYVKDANAELLERDLEHLLEHRDEQEERLLSLQSDTFKAYVDIVRRAL